MASHKNRSGALLVCFFCKQGRCGDCTDTDATVREVFVCHCSVCQTPCTETKCRPENIKGRKVKIAAPVCPRCTSSHPGEC